MLVDVEIIEFEIQSTIDPGDGYGLSIRKVKDIRRHRSRIQKRHDGLFTSYSPVGRHHGSGPNFFGEQ